MNKKHTIIPNFRLAQVQDKSLLGEMIESYYLYEGHVIDKTKIESSLNSALTQNPHIRIWIIEVGENAVGYMAIAIGFTIEAGGKDGFLDELYLQESYRGLGIGRRAVDFAIQMCPKLGIKRISLEVEPHNERAKRLYINSGFFTHNRILMSYWID